MHSLSKESGKASNCLDSHLLGKNAGTNPSHGEGTFNLEVEVIVNEPVTSGVPTVSDTDEEVTVTWEAVFFDVSVEEI